ncbi:MAG: hypothetical protein JWM09_383 [Francisellaceae bacterium]|nr:hypothetical protein [Francisellaceae bacterium]
MNIRDFIIIPFDESYTNAMSVAARKTYENVRVRNRKTLMPLNRDLNQFKNLNDERILPKIGSHYNYVVVADDNNNLVLILGNTNHYYLADKAEKKVYAAGELLFNQEYQIKSYNFKAGGYHISVKDLNFNNKRQSILKVLEAVGFKSNAYEASPVEAIKLPSPKPILFSSDLGFPGPRYKRNQVVSLSIIPTEYKSEENNLYQNSILINQSTENKVENLTIVNCTCSIM